MFHDHVRTIQNATNKLIRDAKLSYCEKLGNTLSDPSTGQKTFWTAFKWLSNKKKISNIPPLYENGRYVSNFHHKSKIFNEYFANQCTINDNGSVLPELISKIDKCSWM